MRSISNRTLATIEARAVSVNRLSLKYTELLIQIGAITGGRPAIVEGLDGVSVANCVLLGGFNG